MNRSVTERESWLVWWYKNALQPFAIPLETPRRLSIVAKIGTLAIGLWLISPSIKPTPVHLLQVLAGGCAGFLYFYVLRFALWRDDKKEKLRAWKSLGDGASEQWWASSGLAVTLLVYAAFEEVLWRYIIQQHLLNGTPAAVAVVVIAFCAEHFIWQRPRSVSQALEFLGVAACLGISVPVAGSIVPAIFMHWTRNLCVLRCYDGL
jgi:membrane protease YdiL (CAAX protease family)